MSSHQIYNDSDQNIPGGAIRSEVIDLFRGLNKTALPLALFYVEAGGKVVLASSYLEDLLGIPSSKLRGNSLQDFIEYLVSLSNNPDLTRIDLNRRFLNTNVDQAIQISIRGEKPYDLTLRYSRQEERNDGFWGFITDRSADQEINELRANILEGLFQESRKLSAAVGGNIDALSSNVRTWNPDVVDDFLFNARDQLQGLNGNLDLVLNYINVINARAVFPETVNLRDFLEDIIRAYSQAELHLMDSDDLDISSLSLYLDPALSRLAFSYLIDEISSKTLSDQAIDIIGDQDNDMVRIRIQGGRTLPLPGLSEIKEESISLPHSPEVHLAKSIFSTLGGEIRLERNPIEQGAGINITVYLPKVTSLNGARSPQRKPAQEQEGRGRILVVETQAEYQLSINDALRNLGYRVDLATEGNAALDMVQRINPDAVLTARNLPGMDGILLTEGIRRWSAVPVIMLSSRLSIDDLGQAFQAGVDDYLRKPFLVEELIFRLKANLKRSGNSGQPMMPDIYNEGDIRIDYSTRQVWRSGKPVQLTPIEFNLLVYMSRQGKQIMTYDQLLERVWEGPEKGSRQGLFVHVRRLREKIESDPENPRIITNKWGVGYEFNP